MKAGLAIWLERPLPECAELAAVAEGVGFSEVWLPDHYFLRDSYAGHALMARRTSRIRFGTAVASPLLHHPALLASSVATIDELSGGRAILGIGVGGWEFPTQLGIPIRRPLRVVREAVDVIRALWRGESDVRGDVFTAAGAKLGWQARPDIPVYVGARGPNMLQLAGEIGDGAITHGITRRYLEFCMERLAEGASAAGRPADACELVPMAEVEVDDDRAAAVERLRPVSTIMAGGEYSEELIEVFGLDREDAMRLRAAVRAGEPDLGRYVTDQMVDSFSIGGPAAHLAERAAQMESLGVRHLICTMRGDPTERMARRIEDAGKALAGVLG
ncbi:MAG: LLM class flavin-dependent oxidoreductase [Actinomycetota bacterium]